MEVVSAMGFDDENTLGACLENGFCDSGAANSGEGSGENGEVEL